MRTRAWMLAAAAVALAGVALRLHLLGRYGFSTDEAWVALVTRATTFRDASLAAGVSPLGWTALVELASFVPWAPPQLTLRLVPFAFGCLSLWMAHRCGARLAGHPIGGIAALAVVAFDPLAIGYAKFLKQYTAETFLTLLAFDRLGIVAERPTAPNLRRLALVLCLGIPFSHAHLVLGPPLLGAVGLVALGRREWPELRRIVVAGLVVGAVAGTYHLCLIAPRFGPGLDAYWRLQNYVPTSSLGAAVGLVGSRGGHDLARLLGHGLVVPTMLALVGVTWTTRQRATIVLGLVLLVLEMIGLSMARVVPINQPRVLLFLHVTLAVHGAAALATLVALAWSRSALVPVGWAGLVAMVVVFAAERPWHRLGPPQAVEDVAPLVRLLDRERRAGDRVLVHARGFFPYAYHQRRQPLFMRGGTGAGFLPVLNDRDATVVDDRTLPEHATAALAASPRLWFIASRLAPWQQRAARQRLSALGRITLTRRRPRAMLLRVERAPVSGSPARR